MNNNNQINPNFFPGGNPMNFNGNGNSNNQNNFPSMNSRTMIQPSNNMMMKFNNNQMMNNNMPNKMNNNNMNNNMYFNMNNNMNNNNMNNNNMNNNNMYFNMNNNMNNNNMNFNMKSVMNNNINYNKNSIANSKNAELENQIRDHLKCYICLSEIVSPKMCKFCKRICCKQCIDKWLISHPFCGICKHELSPEDMVDLPFLDGFSQFFINYADTHPNNNNNNNDNNNNNIQNNNVNNNNLQNNNNNINAGEIGNNRDICQKHKSKIEYYCVQCNNYFCSNCLVFFGEEVKRHQGHLIMQLSKMNELGIKEALNEYKKLPKTKKVLDDLIGKCNFKLRENTIKIQQIENFINLIKNSYIDKIDETSKEFNSILTHLKTQKESVENSINSIPNGFNNIINSNDYAQSSIVSNELKKINKIDDTLENNIKEKAKINPTLFIENYETDYIKIKLPHGSQYYEGEELLNHNINNIPGFPCKLIVQYLQNKAIISFSVEINLPLNAPDYPRFYNYIGVRNQKYGLEFTNLSEQNFLQNNEQGNQSRRIRNQVNSKEIDAEQFISLAGDDKIIRMKVYTTKLYFK